MPTLNWIGKDAVINHHLEVPFHLLKDVPELSCGDPGSGNLIVEGDNLVALKALLPYYKGKVKCICIDPPYNTGSEGWTYNDNVNSPAIRKWIGDTVGGEGETLDRHDRWLCMMYPRLALLRDFLTKDGSIWVCLDDNEVHALRYVMDELFGTANFVSSFAWEKDQGRRGDTDVSSSHDHIILYAKDRNVWRKTRNLLPRTAAQESRYRNPDNDPRGPWLQGDNGTAKSGSEGARFPIKLPSGREVVPPSGNFWRFSKENFESARAEGRAYFGKKGNSMPVIKRYLTEVQQGVVPRTWWPASDVGTNQDAKRDHLRKLLPDLTPFATPKPEPLIERILAISTKPGDLVLDSFLGSGTTAAVSQKMGRKWIGVEMEGHSESHCVPRLKKVMDGEDSGGVTASNNWKGGGGFRYVRLGEALYDEHGRINESKVRFADLARHVYFSETGEPLPKERISAKTPLLGVHHGRAVYLFYNGILKDKSVDGGNVLTSATLDHLPAHDGPKVVYAAGCRFSKARLERDGITFKQTPYAIRTR